MKMSARAPEPMESPDPVPVPAEPYLEDVSLIALANALLRRWKLVLAAPILGALLALALVALSPRQYVATSVFAPQSSDQGASRVAGLAAQFGVNLGPVGGSAMSVDFYGSLLQTRGLLKRVVSSEYGFGDDGGARSLIDYYGIDAPNEEQAERAAVGQLARQVQVTPDSRIGTVTLQVEARDPQVAVQVNQRILEMVEDFNVARRQSQAREEYEFVVDRLESAQQDLLRAETALQGFLDTNRSYESSTQLRFEAERLQREVELRQSVYSTLAQAAEQAAIEQVRNTPVLTVVEHPQDTVRPRKRSYATALVMGVLGGGLIGVVLALGLAFVDRERSMHSRDLSEFRRLRAAISRELRLDRLKARRRREGGE